MKAPRAAHSIIITVEGGVNIATITRWIGHDTFAVIRVEAPTQALFNEAVKTAWRCLGDIK